MSSSANVLSVQALEELKGALGRFGAEARDSLQATEQEIRRTLGWLQERVNHWQHEVERRQREVDVARRAYEACIRAASASGSRTATAIACAPLEAALQAAEARLAQAVVELENTRRWKMRVEQAVTDYQRQAQQMAAFLHSELPNAKALLGHKIVTLHSYIQDHAMVMGKPGPTPETYVGDAEQRG